MYLSRVEIFGFKSFPQRTVLAFDGGITAIVGPNGCGKTNILDAIRWSMGEQRPTVLRGTKMDEVIFNGSRSLKALGLAEVTLSIQNDRGVLPSEYEEVAVTRRLLRTGESEYLLNQIPCRLKDITDLFLDTGMGAHAYSVIHQEMVDLILSSKSSDRRELFEEAAGVAKYKQRRTEALRKLDTTQADLLRLSDLSAEVEKQVTSLKRQVKKAERHQRYTAEIKTLELLRSRHEYFQLRRRRDVAAQEARELEGQKQTVSADLATLELSLENHRLQETEAEKRKQGAERALLEFRESVRTAEQELLLARERREQAQKDTERLQSEIGELEEKEKALAGEVADLKTRGDYLARTMKKKETDLEGLQTYLETLRGETARHRHQLEGLRQSLLELEASLGEVKGDLAGRESRRQEWSDRRHHLQQEETKQNQKLQALVTRSEEVKKELAQKREALERKQKQQAGLEAQVQAAREELVRAEAGFAQLKNEQAVAVSQRDFWRQVVEANEGYPSGVRTLLQKPRPVKGVLDTLANLLTVEARYARAVEAALGEAAGCLVCLNAPAVQKAIAYLNEHGAGRAAFLPLDYFSNGQKPPRYESKKDFSRSDVCGWAVDFVRCAPELRPLAAILLAGTLVVESGTLLWELVEAEPAPAAGFTGTIVSLDGEIVRSSGLISGGGDRETGLVGRAARLAAREEEIAVREKQIRESARRLESLGKQVTALAAKSETQKREMERNRSLLHEQTLEHERFQIESEAQHQQILLLAQERKEIEAHLARGETAGKEEKADLLALQEERGGVRLETEQLAKEIERLESAESEQVQKIGDARLELVSLQGQFEHAQENSRRLGELVAEIRKSQAEKTSHRLELAALTSREQTSGTSFEDQQAGRLAKEEVLRSAAAAEEQRLDSLRQKRALVEGKVKGQRMSRDEAVARQHQVELALTELKGQLQQITSRLQAESGISPEALAPVSDEEAAHLEDLPGQLQELRTGLDSLGPVNLLALEEYESQKKRFEFLAQQMADLQKAREQLQTTIEELNRQALEQFNTTFRQVRDNFQAVFAELFEGGEADVTLTGTDDPLEMDIAVFARPKGKKLVTITQLSGGERALTAIALLFALYLVKPSPFCILDEVDAPLDDANIDRFLKLIKRFARNTQFIVITHNKKTMEAADVLYGVTMEEPGVSRIVSVRLSELVPEMA